MIRDPHFAPDGGSAAAAPDAPRADLADASNQRWFRHPDYAAAVLAARHALERWHVSDQSHGATPDHVRENQGLRGAGARLSAIGGPMAVMFAMHALYSERDPRHGEAVTVLEQAWREFR